MRWFVSWTSASRYGQEVPEGDEVPPRFEEIDAVMIATRSWFEHIDLDASGSIDRCKVLMSTGARAHTHTHTHTHTHIWWERQHRHSRMHVCEHTHTHFTRIRMRIRTGRNLQRNWPESASQHLPHPRCGNITTPMATTRWM
jgi:hypothetical protein